METVTDLDRRQAERRAKARKQVAATAQESHGDADKPATTEEPPRPWARKGDRWRAYNAFVDVIAPRLTLAERAVWFVMFRHAREGVVDTSERALATAARIDKATAGKALRRLVSLRLAWVIRKSGSKDWASRYGLHPRPADVLAAVIADDDQRQLEAHQRREQNGGDRRGRRRQSPEPGE